MSDLIELAKQQAAEIASAGHNGWGNTMLELAAALEAAREQLDWAVKENDRLLAEGSELTARAERLAEALRVAEAALADIGDADREPGDDVEWCERRAALGLRRVRDTLRDHDSKYEHEEDTNDR